ncbi:MAG: DNA-processing protein DprA [Formivibrio sp.]|nr:DNA-processing protein DprA [Formivibrio sp.]
MPLNADAETWLRFVLTPLSCRIRLKLLREFGSPQAVLESRVGRLQDMLEPKLAMMLADAGCRSEWAELASHLAWLSEPGNRLLTLADAAYPASLLDLPDAPAVLFIKGDPAWLSRPALALVGSRQATPQGLENAEAFASNLSQAGYTVISGMAAGIDAAAHTGGLAGAGSTVAVVGTGLDRVYPASNRQLAHRIVECGAMVSEFPLGYPPKAEHFPRRNRLIAALGLGCLVVEATLGSGSLITARQAADLGREVFAIPGSIHSPQSKGCHRLIKEGAKLVESAQDIHDELSAPLLPGLKPVALKQRNNEDPILLQMGWDPVDLDTLSTRTGTGADVLGAVLLTLELDGLIAVLPGGRYQRKG